jgi:ZIP family zinc transporter
MAVLTPEIGTVTKAVLYGLSTGVFAHVALDMIPECTGGGSGHGHGDVSCDRNGDHLRQHTVFSTVGGAGAVFVIWLLLAA